MMGFLVFPDFPDPQVSPLVVSLVGLELLETKD